MFELERQLPEDISPVSEYKEPSENIRKVNFGVLGRGMQDEAP
jgi:hypothetical protein